MSDEQGEELGESPRDMQAQESSSHSLDGDPLPRASVDQLVQRLLDSPDAMQALTQALAPTVGQREHPGEDGTSSQRWRGPPRACAHGAPSNAVISGVSAHAGQFTPNAGYSAVPAGQLQSAPNAGYSGSPAGLFTPNTGYMNPQMGYISTVGYPFIPVHLP